VSSKKDKKNIWANGSPVEDGYLSLDILSEKYGYAKDHIGRLARTGRIQAIRYGNRGQWYAKEEEVRDYQISKEKRFSQESSGPEVSVSENNLATGVVVKNFVPMQALEQPRQEVGIVLSALRKDSKPEDLMEEYSGLESSSEYSVLSNDQSSLSAKKEKTVTKRINAVLASSVMLAGVLIFLYLAPVQFGLANSWFNIITDKIKSPIAYLIDNFLKFADMFHIVFEQGIIKVANVISDKLTSKELCLEDVCVNRDQLKALLELNAIPISTSSPSVASEVTPELEITLSPTLSPTPTESPAASSDEASLAPEEREATPTQSPSITPDTIPAGE